MRHKFLENHFFDCLVDVVADNKAHEMVSEGDKCNAVVTQWTFRPTCASMKRFLVGLLCQFVCAS